MKLAAIAQTEPGSRNGAEKELTAFENPLLFWSAFKVWIAFKDGKTRTFYSKDSQATLKQLQTRRIDPVALDREQGYLGLVKMIERYNGRYTVARILSAYTDGKLFREYKAGTLCVCSDPDFANSPKTLVQSSFTLGADQMPFLLEVPLNTRGKEFHNLKK